MLIWHVDQDGQLAVRLACPAPDGPEPATSDYGRRIDLMRQLVAATPRSREPELVDRPRREAPMPPAIVADDDVFRAARLEALGLRQQARDRFRELAAQDALPVTAAATRLPCAGLLRYAPESLPVPAPQQVAVQLSAYA